MAKLPQISMSPFSAIRATVKFAFVSAYGGGGSRPSNYTHPGDPREMSVNRLPARSVLDSVRFLSVNCCQNPSGKFAREFLPGNSPGKFLPENSREISPWKLPGGISSGKLPGNFSRETPPGNFFRKTPGKFLPENSREISSGKLPGNFFPNTPRKFSPGKSARNFAREIKFSIFLSMVAELCSVSLHGSGAALRFMVAELCSASLHGSGAVLRLSPW